ncbi:MAG TPA: Do family serine endopeptidase [Bacteroidales bacterium]|nr:Do family serine endopeptidase [Bacteroidales bacterium]
MKSKQVLLVLIAAIIGGLVSVFGYSALIDNKEKTIIQEREPVSMVSLKAGIDSSTDFTFAAEKTVNAVVNVKTQSTVEYRNPIYEFFYGDKYPGEQEPVTGIGSGVIITADGYIVTNNHVIENSEKVTVTLNDKREFEAKVVGTDHSTDLALLKIDTEGLPFITFGNSDNLRIGEWVLAVGNPFNISSTVTAGIVSAKGRSMQIIEDNYRIESFIQTDASVNRGNSGGALVNLKGEMVGINTAILSPTGGNVGISFAIPSSIVEKVVKDLIEFGTVQRGIMGVQIQDISAELAKKENLSELNGVYVSDVNENSAAQEAGIEAGDVITEIEGIKVKSPSELQELVSRHRPGDKISVTVKRKDKTKQFEVKLRNLQGDTSVVKAGTFETILGAKVVNLTDQEKQKLGIKNGVKVTDLQEGKLKQEGVKPGFIITQVNNTPIQSVAELEKLVNNLKGGVYIEGVYPNGMVAYYAFGL